MPGVMSGTAGCATICKVIRGRSAAELRRSNAKSSPNAASACRVVADMNLEPTDFQLEIAAGAAEFLCGELPLARLLREDLEPGQTSRRELGVIAAQGWIGATLPADVDGSQLSLTDEIMLAREAGRGLAPFGLLPGALAARLAFRAGNRPLVSALVQGKQVVGLCTPRAAPSRVALYGACVGDMALALTPTEATLLEVLQSGVADSSVDPSVPMIWS